MPLHKVSSGFKRGAEPDNEANKRQHLDEAGAPPRSASWNGLPVEMVAETVRNLITDDVHETARNLNDIGFVDRFHRSVVTSDPQLARIDGGLSEACAVALQLSQALMKYPGGESIALHGRILSELSPVRRRGLARAALDQTGEDRVHAISGLLVGTPYLDPQTVPRLRNTLLHTQMPHVRNGIAAAAALGLWNAGAENLDQKDRSVLVRNTCAIDADNVISVFREPLGDMDHGTARHGGIGEALKHLPPAERSSLVDIIPKIAEPIDRATAIGSMAPGFAHLKPQEVEAFLGMICNDHHPLALGTNAAWAVCDLGPAVEALTPEQVGRVMQVITDPTHAHYPIEGGNLRANALGTFALKVRDPDELSKIITDSTHPDYLESRSDVSIVVAHWGSKLEVFKPEQRSEFVKILTDHAHPRFLTEEEDISHAISGLARGLAYLQPEERSALVGRTLGLENSAEKAKTIAGFGQELQYLKPEERSALVQAIPYLDKEEQASAICGIGQGLGHLKPEERSRLVTDANQLFHESLTSDSISAATNGIAGLMSGVRNWTTDLLNNNKSIVVKVRDPLPDNRSRDRDGSVAR